MGVEMFRLDGRVAWVTGGARGLGRVMAEALAGVGADVVVSSRTAADAESAAAQIAAKHKVRALGLAADVTDPAAVRNVVETAAGRLGGIDILVNNAGINIRKPTVDLPLEDWHRVIETNLTGPFVCTQAAAPGMVKKGWGRIIHISSALGLVGWEERPAYCAGKGGLVVMTKTQALEFARTGVTVNAVCPGPFATEINKPVLDDPAKKAALLGKIPMNRLGEMNELDGAVVFLASPASSYVTGIALSVDGGWTAH
jgi:NAD(P)-dependent dehydrogenase (short-subunit alcohol dehydrogenase family)